MAYRIGNISPLDLSSGRTAVGVGFPFSGNAVFRSTYRTVDAYKSNLMVYFLTAKGERYYDPNFGSDLKKLLFEQPLSNSRKSLLIINLKEDLALYFPKLVVDEIDIDSFEEGQVLQLYIRFHILNTTQEAELTINY